MKRLHDARSFRCPESVDLFSSTPSALIQIPRKEFRQDSAQPQDTHHKRQADQCFPHHLQAERKAKVSIADTQPIDKPCPLPSAPARLTVRRRGRTVQIRSSSAVLGHMSGRKL